MGPRAAPLEKDGVEADLRELLADAPEWCRQARLVRREWPTGVGPWTDVPRRRAAGSRSRSGGSGGSTPSSSCPATWSGSARIRRWRTAAACSRRRSSAAGARAAEARGLDWVEVDFAELRGERVPELTLFGYASEPSRPHRRRRRCPAVRSTGPRPQRRQPGRGEGSRRRSTSSTATTAALPDPDRRGRLLRAGMDLKAFMPGERPTWGPRLRRHRAARVAQAADRRDRGLRRRGRARGRARLRPDRRGARRAIGIPEVKRSLVAAAGALLRLPSRIPYHVAMELALTGEPIDAERVHQLGIVNRLTEPGGRSRRPSSWRRRSARTARSRSTPPSASCYAAADWSRRRRGKRQREIIGPGDASEDAQEGAVAFAESATRCGGAVVARPAPRGTRRRLPCRSGDCGGDRRKENRKRGGEAREGAGGPPCAPGPRTPGAGGRWGGGLAFLPGGDRLLLCVWRVWWGGTSCPTGGGGRAAAAGGTRGG